MPVLQKGVAALTNRMPKVISPKGHAFADYVTIGAFGFLAYAFWKRNKHAAIAAMSCGVAELTTTLLADFPGGLSRRMSFATKGKIDMGLAAVCTSMPNLMGFDDEPEARWFRILGLGLTAYTGLTEFRELERESVRRRRAA